MYTSKKSPLCIAAVFKSYTQVLNLHTVKLMQLENACIKRLFQSNNESIGESKRHVLYLRYREHRGPD